MNKFKKIISLLMVFVLVLSNQFCLYADNIISDSLIVSVNDTDLNIDVDDFEMEINDDILDDTIQITDISDISILDDEDLDVDICYDDIEEPEDDAEEPEEYAILIEKDLDEVDDDIVTLENVDSDIDVYNGTGNDIYYKSGLLSTTLNISGSAKSGYTKLDLDSVTSKEDLPWHGKRLLMTKVIIDEPIKPTSMAYWFTDMGLVTNKNFTNMDLIDTSDCTSFHKLFAGCVLLSEFPISNWETEKVTTMKEMFNGCTILKNLDLSSWDTSNVTDFSGMFKNCRLLESIGDFDFKVTDNATDINEMFLDCLVLKSINCANWDVSNVRDFDSAFKNCAAITELDVSSFDTTNAITMNSMFEGCRSLGTLSVGDFTIDSVASFDSMFKGCIGLTELDVSNWNVGNATTFTSLFENCKALTSLDVSRWNVSSATTFEKIFKDCSNVSELDVSNWKADNVINMENMFDGCSSLTDIDLALMETPNLEKMRYIFNNCKNVETIDVSLFDLSNISGMSNAFNGCNNLQRIYANDLFIAPDSVLEAALVFVGCTKLVGGNNTIYNLSTSAKENCRIDKLDQTGLLTDKNLVHNVYKDTEDEDYVKVYRDNQYNEDFNKVPDGDTFADDQKIYIDISPELDKVIEGVYLIDENDVRYDATYISVEKGNIREIYEFTIEDAKSYTVYVDGIPHKAVRYYIDGTELHFTDDTSCEDYHIFGNEWTTEELDIMRNITYVSFDFDLDIDTTANLFNGFTSLEDVYLYGLSNANIIDTTNMFKNCTNLQHIYASEEQYLHNVPTSDDMFFGCNKLSGGNNSKCDGENFIDCTYAKAETINEIGYFTNLGISEYVIADESSKSSNLVFYREDQNENEAGDIFAIDQVIYTKVCNKKGEITNIEVSDFNGELIGDIKSGFVEKVSDNLFKFVVVDESCVKVIYKVTPPPTPTPTPHSGGSGGGSSSGGGESNGTYKLDATNQHNTLDNPLKIKRFDKVVYPLLGNFKWENTADNNYRVIANINGNEIHLTNNFYNLIEIDKYTGAISNGVYYFNDQGMMATGFVYDELSGDTYYFNPENTDDIGKMAIGWTPINDAWHFFDLNGKMLKNTVTPDGKLVDENGKFIG